MYIIHAFMQVNPEKEAAFLSEAQKVIAGTRTEAGNVSYELYKNAEADNSYVMLEVWKDMEAIGAHNNSEHFKAFAGKAGEFLTAPLDVKLYTAEQQN